MINFLLTKKQFILEKRFEQELNKHIKIRQHVNFQPGIIKLIQAIATATKNVKGFAWKKQNSCHPVTVEWFARNQLRMKIAIAMNDISMTPCHHFQINTS